MPKRLAKLSAWMVRSGFASALAWFTIGFASAVLIAALLDSAGLVCVRPPP